MRVLIAVEDKVFGEAIAEFVGAHKWEAGSKFKVIHVANAEELYQTSDSFCCEAARDMVEERDRRARSLVKGIAAQITTKLGGAEVIDDIIYGKPKEIILDEADNWKADVVVMGSHGRTGFSRFLLGSVSLSVLSQAPCSVMIVKLPQLQEELKAAKEKAKKALENPAAQKPVNREAPDQPVAAKGK
jgi:nucleotide-binding universal stress UspA family protein